MTVLGVAAVQAQAAEPRLGNVEVGAFGGFAWLSHDNQLGNAAAASMRPGSGPALGARLGWSPTEALALEAEAEVVAGQFADSQLSSAVLGWRASAVWHLSSARLRPFVLAGVGGISTLWKEFGTEHDSDAVVHAGVGAKYDVGDRWGVRGDLRYFAMDGASAAIANNFAGYVGLWYRVDAPMLDGDGDGVADASDRCPGELEDRDGFQDGDGCPDPDNDGDGVADASDRCPDQAEDYDGFEDGDGCPEADNDHDGIADAADKCPQVAEDRDGFEDGDGCPDPDNDKDGIADATDKCPNQGGKAEDGGCPLADQDGDGIPDIADKCPTQKETFNGKDDADGCPDGQETVVVSGSGLVIKQKVYFELGSAAVKAESHVLLGTVAAVLRQHQRLTKIAIEGHTDDVGAADENLALSKARAEAVLALLVQAGVAPARLQAEGYGAGQPLCSDVERLAADEAKNKKKLEACRDQNRRVQFRVVEVDGKVVAK